MHATPLGRRVLSIQSHVVSGYVGNRVATFALQALAWEVDAVNTVQFSNHAGYHRHGGNRVDAATLESIFTALDENGLLNQSRLLTGYIPSQEALLAVVALVRRMHEKLPQLIYLLDPVMGDDGRLYVAEDVVPIYRDVLLPLATIITPNWFEVELLTGVKITTLASLREALRILHLDRGVSHVVISSLPVSPLLASTMDNFPDLNRAEDDAIYSGKTLLCLCSSRTTADRADEPSIVYATTMPHIKGYFSGVGDMFSALVLAHFDEDMTDLALRDATSCALSTTHTILAATRVASTAPGHEVNETDDEADAADSKRRVRRMQRRELRVVENQTAIRNGGATWDMPRWKGFWGGEANTQSS